MKLVSPKQKISTTGSSERINFSNEIERLEVMENTTYKLSDFNSDIIMFSPKTKKDVEISIVCDRPNRKYTFVALTSGFDIIFDFQGDGRSIDKYSNVTDPIFKAGTRGIIDLYQIGNTTINLVQHTLNLI